MSGSKNRVGPSEDQSRSGGKNLRHSRRLNDRLEERDPWPCKIESLFALTAYNINVNCIWSFPAYCFKHGGVVFFVPYILTIILCGMPLYMMEMKFGQEGGGGLVSLWHCVPLFKGIGYASVVINFGVAVYYAVYGAWTIYYLAASFQSQLPWQSCNNQQHWATTACKLTSLNCTYLGNASFCHYNIDRSNITDISRYQYGISSAPLRLAFLSANDSYNSTSAFEMHLAMNGSNQTQGNVWRLPSHDFFENGMLHATNTIADTTTEVGLEYELILCLLLICIILFLGLIRGAKSVGKACLIMVPFSYIFTTIVLIRTIFAYDGAATGLVSYLYPDWSRLAQCNVWGDAALLAFLTLFPTWGSVANIASHNSPDSKFREDAAIATMSCAASNVFYGFTVAMLIGVLAEAAQMPAITFVTIGPELLFVAVAQALARLPLAPIWSSFLFFSILNIVLGTLMIVTQTVVDSCTKTAGQIGRHWRLLFAAIVCCAIFLLGLAFVCKIGIYVTLLFDRYCNWWNTIVLAFLETIILSCISCFDKNGGTENNGSSKCNWFLHCGLMFWHTLASVALLLILAYALFSYGPTTFGAYKYPDWAEALGWTLTAAPLLLIPLAAIKVLAQAEGGSLIQKLRNSVKPDATWVEKRLERESSSQHGRDAPGDMESGRVLRKFSDTSDRGVLVIEQPPNNMVMVLPPPPDPADRKPLRIAATEPALKAGKINRGTQMTRDIAAQTGDETGEGAYVEYPEHFDHPEFFGVVGGKESKGRKKRKDKHKKKDKKHKKRDKSKPESDDEEPLPPPPEVPKPITLEVQPMEPSPVAMEQVKENA